MPMKQHSKAKRVTNQPGQDGTSPHPSLNPDTLAALEARTKEENLLSKNTTKAYHGYVTAGRQWLGELCSISSTELPSGCPPSDESGNAPDTHLPPDFVSAFNPTPNVHSPEALALYITFKCVDGNRGKSTAEGIHAAFKNMWEAS